MAVWFIPALKAILPHIGSILAVAVPVFTKKNADVEANQALLQQQITELQSAASQNALLIKELAAQLQSTVAALEHAAAIADARPRRMFLLSVAAIVLSAISLSVTLYFIFARQ
jgi:hypothetical protein